MHTRNHIRLSENLPLIGERHYSSSKCILFLYMRGNFIYNTKLNTLLNTISIGKFHLFYEVVRCSIDIVVVYQFLKAGRLCWRRFKPDLRRCDKKTLTGKKVEFDIYSPAQKLYMDDWSNLKSIVSCYTSQTNYCLKTDANREICKSNVNFFPLTGKKVDREIS